MGVGNSFMLAQLVVKLQYLFLSPLVLLAVPSEALLGLQVPAILIVLSVGSLGMLRKNELLARSASLSLLVAIIGGKVGTDILGGVAPDTAGLLLEFVAVIFFIEAGKVVISFEMENRELAKKQDELSLSLARKLALWAQGQLAGQARIAAGASALSLGLLVLGGFSSVSINQLAFSAALVLVAVGVLLFLLTNRREPER
jgi:hypothetical protein